MDKPTEDVVAIGGFLAMAVGIVTARWKKRLLWVIGAIVIGLLVKAGYDFKHPDEAGKSLENSARASGPHAQAQYAVGNGSNYHAESNHGPAVVAPGAGAVYAPGGDLKIGAPESPEEVARKKRIREQLGKFVGKLMAQDLAARSGWSPEFRKTHNAEDPLPEIQKYLRENLDESYATRVVYPEVEDLAKKYDNPNQGQYQGQGESELARMRIRFLNKTIDELK